MGNVIGMSNSTPHKLENGKAIDNTEHTNGDLTTNHPNGGLQDQEHFKEKANLTSVQNGALHKLENGKAVDNTEDANGDLKTNQPNGVLQDQNENEEVYVQFTIQSKKLRTEDGTIILSPLSGSTVS